MPPRGLEHTTGNTEKTPERQHGGAKCDAFPPDLQSVIDAWPNLSEQARRDVLALIDAASR
jgi:hypothetical protein